MSKYLIFLSISFVILFSSCSDTKSEESKDQPALNVDQVLIKLKEHGINLEEEPRNPNSLHIFHRIINGVEPNIYTNDGSRTLVIYVFSSIDEAVNGKEEFYDIPADIVEHLTFEINNILIFCLGFDEKLEEKMNIVVSELKEVADNR